MDLAGKVALVSGGSRGIGAAIATALAREGADVAITYVSAVDKAQAVVAQIQALGRRALALRADSADVVEVRAAVEQTAAEFGALDILVNNAGIALMGPLQEVTLEDVDRTLSIHVRASFVAAQAAARHMRADGRVINIGSCLAERVAGAEMTLYAMSKSALIGLSKGLAFDLGPRGITANVVHPGPIDTDMNPADSAQADEQRAKLALGHFGTAADVAATVVHLAGPGGRFITGTSIAVDGGSSA
ncbi:NAD(P)-dependent dehydrogenase (short-subunit alcohol dehydrogenase family) [Luteimonas cucumeris]|uniref:NAD(P)-dependent dehydrogenase (Short-subunit alcohol dehydrogenase family) n=1 Tax=Luteimonas cucumeris TaxID=985012 RepID=A0A562LEE4_9GAMM|nr:SDR family oxidoreductase [Luteimonas cucumeris]TWI05988.1 NAD(P)-dependent dehydrogenase (short-subunit alcohol dehydrogenase family) [Luteimonas cucumeris]